MDIYNLILMIVIVGIVASIISLTVVGENKEVRQIINIILLILIIILIFYVIYSVYEYYRRIIINEPMLLSGIHPANRLVNISKPLPPSLIGDEYTYSMWIYINNWNYGKAVPILQTESGNPSIWLYPYSNNMMIRFKLLGNKNKPVYNYCKDQLPQGYNNTSENHYTDSTVDDCLNILHNNPTSRVNSILVDKLKGGCKLISTNSCSGKNNTNTTITPGFDIYQRQSGKFNPNMINPTRLSTNDTCDISGIPVQRWFHLGVVFWNRTTDIYLNGKLVRSCVLPNIANFQKRDKVTIGSNKNQEGLDGKLGNIRYFNRSLNATQIYKLYSKGPLQWNIFKEFEDIFPKINIKINTRYDFE